ncbi:MAG: FAD/NAD(P)-binding oxidoreductase, partial [bacterium]
MPRRIVVVGGGAAGMSAASAARRTDHEALITVLESGPFPSYGVCGLPYYLGGVVESAESLVAYPASEFRDRRRIDLRLETSVDRIDLEGRVVVDAAGEHHPYDALVFAAGAAPVVPPIPGVDDPRVVTIRRLDDAIDLHARLEGLDGRGERVRSAAVVGAGYVGLEMAEALHGRGIDVTVIDRLPRVMTTVDPVVADLVEEEVRRHCRLLLDAPLEAIVADDTGLVLHCGVQGSGEAPEQVGPVDLVVLALGVRPATGLLPSLAALPNGALLVDERGRTSDPHVFSAGDCAAVFHRVLGGPAYVPLGPAANKAGRVAGTVAAGGDAEFAGVVGTAVVKVFDLAVAHT